MLFFLLIAVAVSAQERALLRKREVNERVLLDQEDATVWGRLVEESSMYHHGKKGSKKGGKKEVYDVTRKMQEEATLWGRLVEESSMYHHG